MDKENINKEITRQELAEIIGEEIDAKIKRKEIDIDMDAIAEIAKSLKRDLPAGDELRNKAFEVWRQRLIDEELEKRSDN